MNLEEFVNGLDFNNYDYFYHETGKAVGESILEEGLPVDGTNILDVDNILFTTACPFTKDKASSLSTFIDEEYSPTRVAGYIDMGSKEFIPNNIYLEISEDKGVGIGL